MIEMPLHSQPNVVLFIALSLDGKIAGENEDISWLFSDQDYNYSTFFKGIDSLIMGSKTYLMSLSFGSWVYNDKKVFVLTTRTDLPLPKEEKHKKQINFYSGDLKKLVSSLKNQFSRNIWLVGGGKVVSEFLNLDLIDEFVLSIHPTVLGVGIDLFQNISKHKKLKLKKVEEFCSGLVQITYTRI